MGESWEQALPESVAKTLVPHQRRALSNRTRRRILRELENTSGPMTLANLAMAIPATSISSISYHVLVLEECGCVLLSVALADQTGRGQGVSPTIGQHGPVREALDAMRKLDDLDG